MRPLEFDLEKIRYWRKKREDENISFRTYLKGQDSDRIDGIVHRLNNEISSQIDCDACGNCCKEFSPRVSETEIIRLAEIDCMDVDTYIETHTVKGEMENSRYLKQVPCKYLDGTRCSILNDRPEECNSYPYLHKDGFITRLWGVIDNYAVCPIVFNVFEELKDKLRFRRCR